MGTAVIEFLADNGFINNRIFRIGIGDEFVTHGAITELQKITGIDEEGILRKIIEVNELIKQEQTIVVVQEQNNLRN